MNKPDSEIGVYSSDKRVYNHERSFYKSLVPLILAKEECVVASIEHDDLPSVLLVLGHLSYYVSCWKIRGGGKVSNRKTHRLAAFQTRICPKKWKNLHSTMPTDIGLVRVRANVVS